MAKIIFLIPPSEGKKSENKYSSEELNFNFKKPLGISKKVDEKDLKCKGNKFLGALELNKNIENSETTEAINRYSGVMYSAIDCKNMQNYGKKYFENYFLILSGMYGIVKPLDKIGNYKLPIDSKGLFDFWEEKIVKKITELKPEYIVNLLPISYSKLLGLAKCRRHIYKRDFLLDAGIKIININFLKENGDKVSHGVKKIKGEWIKNICEKNITDYKNFGGEIVENGNIIDVNIVVK